MSTRHTPGSRDALPDLLSRPPTGAREFVAGWSDLIVDPVRQLEVLADLYGAGLLSREEFEHYKSRVTSL